MKERLTNKRIKSPKHASGWTVRASQPRGSLESAVKHASSMSSAPFLSRDSRLTLYSVASAIQQLETFKHSYKKPQFYKDTLYIVSLILATKAYGQHSFQFAPPHCMEQYLPRSSHQTSYHYLKFQDSSQKSFCIINLSFILLFL